MRGAAIEALGKLVHDCALAPLIALCLAGRLDGKKAFEALHKLHWEPATAEQRASLAILRLNVTDAVAEGQFAVGPLISAIRSFDLQVSTAAIRALGELGDARAVEPVISALKDRAYVQSAAIEALGELGDPRAVEPLVAASRSRDFSVRATSVMALGSLGDPRAFEPLVAAITADEAHVDTASIRALGMLGDSRAVRTAPCRYQAR